MTAACSAEHGRVHRARPVPRGPRTPQRRPAGCAHTPRRRPGTQTQGTGVLRGRGRQPHTSSPHTKASGRRTPTKLDFTARTVSRHPRLPLCSLQVTEANLVCQYLLNRTHDGEILFLLKATVFSKFILKVTLETLSSPRCHW